MCGNNAAGLLMQFCREVDSDFGNGTEMILPQMQLD